MRLHELQIKNFRKLKDCKINFRDTTFLIGSNNAGKSSVFKAIDYLHKALNTSREDFSKTYDEAQDDYIYAPEIEMIAEYQNVPHEAKEWVGFKGRVIPTESTLENETGNSIIYKKVWKLNGSKPTVWMKELKVTVKEKYQAATVLSELVGEDWSEEYLKEFFSVDKLDAKVGSKKVSEKLRDLPEYWDIQTDEDEASWIENPGGIPGNVLKRLPNIVIIPAESCMQELTSSGGALHKLLTDLFNNVREKSVNYEKAQEFLKKLASELNPQDADTDFGQLMNGLNNMVGNLFPDSSVHVNASLDVPEKVIKPEFNVEMESNVKTSVNYQGHGMIRATVFELLRFVQNFVNSSMDIPTATIFCFEEPEIYLHPSAANQMRDSLYELAGENCQIIATTHSPYMINLGSDKSMSLTQFSQEGGFTKTHSFNLNDAFLNLQQEEKQNLKMLLKVDDYIARIFFTRKSIFVEGDTEEVVIRETIKRLKPEDRAKVVGNCEFLRARGKSVLISLAKYLNALSLNYTFMHDRDGGTPKAEAFNAPILAQTGAENRIMIEECIEDILGYEPPSGEKPFTAYKYIKDNWGNDFSDLPENWKNIFLDLCSPNLDHLK